MKPSERIEQIFLAEVEAWKKPRHEFSRMMFGDDAPNPSGEIAFALRARALILYLDEQHEPRRVICPECKAAGQRSRCTVLHTEIQDIYIPSYYDEDGLWVSGANNETEALRCSYGHTFHVTARKP